MPARREEACVRRRAVEGGQEGVIEFLEGGEVLAEQSRDEAVGKGGVGCAVEKEAVGEGGVGLEGRGVEGEGSAARVAVLRVGGLRVVADHEAEGGGGKGNMDAITVGALRVRESG